MFEHIFAHFGAPMGGPGCPEEAFWGTFGPQLGANKPSLSSLGPQATPRLRQGSLLGALGSHSGCFLIDFGCLLECILITFDHMFRL